jgi:20S proteasome subunit alpha 6
LSFGRSKLNNLIKHSLVILRETSLAEQDLTTKNVPIGIVGKMEFIIYDDGDVFPFLECLEERPQRKAQPVPPADKSAEPIEDEVIKFIIETRDLHTT